MKSKKRGLARIVAALFYSVDGLRSSLLYEAAFRQEVVLFLLLLPALYFISIPFWFKCLLFTVNSLVLIVELLNSAIESVVDLASPNYHILAKRAKDMGSGAVLLSLLLAGVLWIYALIIALH